MEVTTGFGTVKITMLKGEKGDRGRDGQGMPPGGVRGDVLTKNSAADYQTEWTTLPNATTTTDGLLSAADKTSIDQTYTTGSSGQYLKKGEGRNVVWGSIPLATEGSSGLMSADDRKGCNQTFASGSEGQYLTKGSGRNVTWKTLSNATTSAAGLMSTADKTTMTQLTGGSSGQYLTKGSGTTLTWKTLGNATTSAAGLMSATDKSNLNKITGKDIVRGTFTCDVTTTDTSQTFTKNFPAEMTAAPAVVLTPYKTNTKAKGLYYTITEMTKSGFTVSLGASSTGKVQFAYIAMTIGVVSDEDNPPIQPTEV